MHWENFVLIIVDSYSKWVDVMLMNITTSTMYRIPNQLVTDNGPQFKSEEFRKYLLTNGIKHICTPIYHQSRQVDRYVQIVKKGT